MTPRPAARSTPTPGPVGVFDSGVGGLSVLAQIRALLPEEPLAYVADSAFAPYGEQSEDYVAARAGAIADFLLSRGARALVVACNTATAYTARRLRERLPIPLIAMEPAVKPAAALSRRGIVGVLATGGTLASEQFARLVDSHARGVTVLRRPCPDLVTLVERGVVAGTEAEAAVAPHVRALLAAGADTLVLGCTHFHFLREAVAAVAGPDVRVVEPGAAVAHELRRRLLLAGPLTPPGAGGTIEFWTSGEPTVAARVMAALWPGAPVVTTLPAAYRSAPPSATRP